MLEYIVGSIIIICLILQLSISNKRLVKTSKNLIRLIKENPNEVKKIKKALNSVDGKNISARKIQLIRVSYGLNIVDAKRLLDSIENKGK